MADSSKATKASEAQKSKRKAAVEGTGNESVFKRTRLLEGFPTSDGGSLEVTKSGLPGKRKSRSKPKKKSKKPKGVSQDTLAKSDRKLQEEQSGESPRRNR